jgi:hypothetical protein
LTSEERVCGHLGPAIPRQRGSQLLREVSHLVAERADGGLCVLARDPHEHHEARVALHERGEVCVSRTGDQVSLPMAGNGTVLDLGRALAYRRRTEDERRALVAGFGASWPADRSGPAKVRHELALERTAGLDEQAQVDRLVGHFGVAPV